jgi:hypothetical protein
VSCIFFLLRLRKESSFDQVIDMYGGSLECGITYAVPPRSRDVKLNSSYSWKHNAVLSVDVLDVINHGIILAELIIILV